MSSIFPLGQYMTPQEGPWDYQALPATTSEIFAATADDSFVRNPFSSYVRLLEMDAAHRDENSPFLDEKTLNETYGLDGQLKFEAPMRESAARIMHELKLRELRNQDAMGRARGIPQHAAGFAGGVVSSAADPFGLAANFIPIAGWTRYGKIAQGLIATTAARRLGAAAVVGTTESVVGSALLEPLVYSQAQFEQANYTLADSATNIAFGTIFGTSLHVAGAGIGAYRNARAMRYNLKPETVMETETAAVADLIHDRPVESHVDVIAMSDEVLRNKALQDPEIQAKYGDLLDHRTKSEWEMTMEEYLRSKSNDGVELDPAKQAALRELKESTIEQAFRRGEHVPTNILSEHPQLYKKLFDENPKRMGEILETEKISEKRKLRMEHDVKEKARELRKQEEGKYSMRKASERKHIALDDDFQEPKIEERPEPTTTREAIERIDGDLKEKMDSFKDELLEEDLEAISKHDEKIKDATKARRGILDYAACLFGGGQ